MTHRVPVRAKRQWRSLLVIVAATLGTYTDGDAQSLGPCIGDCDRNGEIVVEELITGVDITLGLIPLEQCPEFDPSDDQRVTVDELGQAVNAALIGCETPTPTLTVTPMIPSATPTPTESPSPTVSVSPTASMSPTTSPSPTPTPTMSPTPSPTGASTPGDVAKSVAGHASVAANAMGAIPSLITSIVSGFQFGSGASASLDAGGLPAFAMDNGGAAGSCPNGGTAVLSCSGFLTVTMTITLTNCGVDTPDGSGTFTGTITLMGTGSCPSIILPPAALTINVQGAFEDQSSNPTLNVSADLTGSATNIQLGGSCFLTGITLTLNGSLSAEVPGDGGTAVTFNSTNVVVTVNQFNADCVPLIYTLKFNGGATFTETSSGDSFDASFQNFMFTQDATSSPTQVELAGGMSSTCFGGAVTIATVEPLLSQYGSPCFTGGILAVTAESGTERVLYFADGGVGIDANLDGTPEQSYASCLAPELLACSP